MKPACKFNTRENPCHWTPDIDFTLKSVLAAPLLHYKVIEYPDNKTILDRTDDVCTYEKEKAAKVIVRFYNSQLRQMTNFRCRCPIEKVSVNLLSKF